MPVDDDDSDSDDAAADYGYSSIVVSQHSNPLCRSCTQLLPWQGKGKKAEMGGIVFSNPLKNPQGDAEEPSGEHAVYLFYVSLLC